MTNFILDSERTQLEKLHWEYPEAASIYLFLKNNSFDIFFKDSNKLIYSDLSRHQSKYGLNELSRVCGMSVRKIRELLAILAFFKLIEIIEEDIIIILDGIFPRDYFDNIITDKEWSSKINSKELSTDDLFKLIVDSFDSDDETTDISKITDIEIQSAKLLIAQIMFDKELPCEEVEKILYVSENAIMCLILYHETLEELIEAVEEYYSDNDGEKDMLDAVAFDALYGNLLYYAAERRIAFESGFTN